MCLVPLNSVSRRVDRLFWVVLCVMLGACGALPEVEQEPVASPETAWQAHARRLAAIDEWSATGRVALRSADDAWNAGIHWRQHGDAYRIRLSGPLGQGLVQIEGGPDMVVMRTAEKETFTAPDPDTLVEDTIGWRIPVAGLRYWLLGRTTPRDPVLAKDLDEAGRLQRVEQGDWTLEYARYTRVGDLALPARFDLIHPRLSGRMVVTRWSLDAPANAVQARDEAQDPDDACPGDNWLQTGLLLDSIFGLGLCRPAEVSESR